MTATEPSTDADSPPSATPINAEFHRYPIYAPRFWHGMRPLTWLGLLRQGGFRVHPSRWSHLIGVSFATPWNTVLAGLQRLIFGRRLAHAELHGPPVFIIGHWRSGTTLLHELMVRDERYSSPSTFQCFAPHHFLVSEWFFRRFLGWLLPGKRPMDNMAAGWERPQEDEFALMNLGLPSPYRRIAFPCQEAVDMDYLDFRDVPDAAVDCWLASLRKFLLAVSSVTGRPLVLKSPTHTGRLAQLARAFPDARFVHVTRDPRALFPSTCRLWNSLSDAQGMQPPSCPGDAEAERRLKDYVLTCLDRMYASFHAARDQVDASRIVDVRYEDLIQDPVNVLENIYQSLKLSDFESVKPNIRRWVEEEHRAYQPNRHRLSPADEAAIAERWRTYFQTYGYSIDEN